MRVLVWNTEWAGPRSSAAGWLNAQRPSEADLVVLTEARAGVVAPWHGYSLDAGLDWGYRLRRHDDRKVVLWSPNPWDEVKTWSEGALTGRIVAGTTEVRGMAWTVVGVCIPWSMAHVTHGRKDASPWSEHLDFVVRLRTILDDLRHSTPRLLLAGDFNQTLPRSRAPKWANDSLQECLAGSTVLTDGVGGSVPVLHHLAVFGTRWPSSSLSVKVIPAELDGRRVSDHDLVEVTFAI